MQLTAEIGLWGYDPTTADPFVLNHRNFPRSTMLSDAATVLGHARRRRGHDDDRLPRRRADRPHGNVNSTWIPDGPFLVGSGGGNDVASIAAECDRRRAAVAGSARREQCGYVTSPGARCARWSPTSACSRSRRLATSSCSRRSRPATEPLDDRIAAARAACGWDLQVADDVAELAPPDRARRSRTLRRWDPRGWFLRAR